MAKAVGLRVIHKLLEVRRIRLERRAKGGNSPVVGILRAVGWYQSTIGHVKPGGKQGGPPPKAKYSLVTDSE
jgi:hypothetical protein